MAALQWTCPRGDFSESLRPKSTQSESRTGRAPSCSSVSTSGLPVCPSSRRLPRFGISTRFWSATLASRRAFSRVDRRCASRSTGNRREFWAKTGSTCLGWPRAHSGLSSVRVTTCVRNRLTPARNGQCPCSSNPIPIPATCLWTQAWAIRRLSSCDPAKSC